MVSGGVLSGAENLGLHRISTLQDDGKPTGVASAGRGDNMESGRKSPGNGGGKGEYGRMSRPRIKFTVDDYNLLPEHPRCELIEGELLLAPSPSPRHQEVVKRLVALLPVRRAGVLGGRSRKADGRT